MRVARLADGYLTKCARVVTNGVFRARVNAGDEPFLAASELWYPPAEVVKQGRFNNINQPKFYVSDRPHGAVLEVRPKVGDFVTLMFAASFADHTEMDVVQIGLHNYAGERDTPKSIALREDKAFLRQLELMKIADKWHKIDDVFADFCSRPASIENATALYKVTNAIGNLFDKIPAAGLMFPSIETSHKAVNLCLATDMADRFFFPGEAWLLQIVDWREQLEGAPKSDTGYYQFKIKASSGPIPAGGKLTWLKDVGDLTPAHIEGAIQMVGKLREAYKEA